MNVESTEGKLWALFSNPDYYGGREFEFLASFLPP